MNIHEYQAKELFRSYDIPVPEGRVAFQSLEAEQIADALGGGLVAVKAQVHTGGRGKAGGVKLAKTPAEAREHAEKILGMDIKGHTVRKVLIEKGTDIAREAYLGLILDRSAKSISFICSAEGGIEIEEVAAKTPEKILRIHARDKVFPENEARAIAGKLFNDESTSDNVLTFMNKLFTLFVEKDCSLAEINPLVLTGDGEVIALDGKINFDDNALYRQPDIVELRDMDEEDINEIEAKEKGLSFVELEGDIGCMVNGAGLAMATMDMIQFFGGKPANFLDVGGSSNPEKVVAAFELILSNPDVKAILINIFGGITRCDDIAKGILAAFDRIDVRVPVVVRLFGTNYEEGQRMLEGTDLVTAESLSDGVKKAIAIAEAQGK
jgi:succinyl-CoA synthetase beta subunit